MKNSMVSCSKIKISNEILPSCKIYFRSSNLHWKDSHSADEIFIFVYKTYFLSKKLEWKKKLLKNFLS